MRPERVRGMLRFRDGNRAHGNTSKRRSCQKPPDRIFETGCGKARDLTSKTVYDYVKLRDAAALKINEMVCEKLARVVGIVINAFAPDRIILGGGVMNAGTAIIDTTWKYVTRYSLPGSRDHCKLVRARCGQNAGVIGAAQLVFEGPIGNKNV